MSSNVATTPRTDVLPPAWDCGFVTPTIPDYVKDFYLRIEEVARGSDDETYSVLLHNLHAQYGPDITRQSFRIVTTCPMVQWQEATSDAVRDCINYFNRLDDVYAHANQNNNFWIFHNEIPLANVFIHLQQGDLNITYQVDRNNEEVLVAQLKLVLPQATHHRVQYLAASRNGVSLRSTTLPIRPKIQRPQDLYPFLSETPDELYDRYMASNSSILFMIGPPGTGKSSYIHQLVQRHTQKGLAVKICDDTNVIEHEGFTTVVRDCENLDLLIIEDADMLIAKREDGNKVMSAILNMTSGIVSKNVRIVVTTNLPNLKSVDEALLRPGRTFKALEFKPLTFEQLNPAREAVGMEPLDIDSSEFPNGLTLAQALNYDTSDQTTVSVTSTQFGFA